MTDPRFLPADLAPPFRNAPQAADGRGQKIRIERIKLASDWAAGGTSFGYPAHWGMESSGATDGVISHQVPESALFLRDPCSLLSGTLAAASYVTVWQPEDATDGHWEPLVSGGASYASLLAYQQVLGSAYATLTGTKDKGTADITIAAGVMTFAGAGVYRCDVRISVEYLTAANFEGNIFVKIVRDRGGAIQQVGPAGGNHIHPDPNGTTDWQPIRGYSHVTTVGYIEIEVGDKIKMQGAAFGSPNPPDCYVKEGTLEVHKVG